MDNGGDDARLRWYAVSTKPHQERRAERNLIGWNVETYNPRVRCHSRDRRGGESAGTLRPLFPGYIFARFRASTMIHKIRFTRGVRDVVCYGGEAAPVDDEIIELIKRRQDEHGHVTIGEPSQASCPPPAADGWFRNFAAIFERPLEDNERVEILLAAVARPPD